MTRRALEGADGMAPGGSLDDGFHEVVAIVRDADASARRLCAAWGYQVLWRGVAAEAAGLLEVTAEAVEVLIGDAAQGRGFLRLVAFPGLRQGVMRDGAQPWDVGGIFDINIRPRHSINTLHAAMSEAGFMAFAPITDYDFSGLLVREVISRDADNVGLALIEQVAPKFAFSDDSPAPASSIFNSTQTVRSLDDARALYVDALGWRPVFETSWSHADTGLNCIGLPLDVARTRRISVGVYQANGLNQGSVEVLEVEGEGRDFTTDAPPKRGLAALRFPLSDLDGFLAAARRGGCRIIPPRRVRLEPYGEVSAGAAITPWGARLEGYQR